MKRRPQPVDTGGLPLEIAAGPRSLSHADLQAWARAGTEWSKANGHGWNGWRTLLSPEVRYATSAKGRLHARALRGDC